MNRNAILHGVTALCSALVFAFFALPYYTVSVVSQSGYQFLDFAFKNAELADSTSTFAAVSGLLLLLVAGLTLVASVVLLLCDLNVIKNEMVTKVAAWGTLVLAGLLVVVAIMNLVGNIVFIGDAAGIDGVSAGWGLTIVTTLLALGACGTTAFAHFKK